MATVNVLKVNSNEKTTSYKLEGLEQGDVCAYIRAGHLSDKPVTATGSFSGSGSVPMQGSNDGTNWFALTDAGDAAIAFAAAGGEVIIENPLFIRPGPVASGDGSTDIDIIIAAQTLK